MPPARIHRPVAQSRRSSDRYPVRSREWRTASSGLMPVDAVANETPLSSSRRMPLKMNPGRSSRTPTTTRRVTSDGAPAPPSNSSTMPSGHGATDARLLTTPMSSPPASVPTSEVKPPKRAAVKPNTMRPARPNEVRPAVGAIRMPAMAASIEPTAQAKPATRSELIPSSRATSRESAVARMAMPRLVDRKNTARATARTVVTARMPMASLEKLTPLTEWLPSGNSDGTASNRWPKRSPASPASTVKSATVAMMRFSVGAPASRRMTKRSTPKPRSPTTTRARARAPTRGSAGGSGVHAQPAKGTRSVRRGSWSWTSSQVLKNV